MRSESDLNLTPDTVVTFDKLFAPSVCKEGSGKLPHSFLGGAYAIWTGLLMA